MRASAFRFFGCVSFCVVSAACAQVSSRPAAPFGVRVTGLALEVNGRTEIPVGLFGVHAAGGLDAAKVADCGIEAVRVIHQQPDGQPSVARPSPDALPLHPTQSSSVKLARSLVVDCYFDRYQPARQLVDPEWRAGLVKLAREYGENAKKTGQRHYLEFWNEPFLNWATRPAVNYSPEYYRTEGIKSGDPMVLRATGKAVEGLVWDRQVFFVQAADGRGIDSVLSSYIPRDGKEGEVVTLGYGAGQARLVDGGIVRIRGKDRVLTKRWSGRDPGQEFYWSGPVNERLYNEMFGVFAAELKKTNPEVAVAAGWGFNFHNEDWAVWERLIRPTLDKNHAWMDALHEHHYGGDTRRVAAAYEVAYAYALGRHGKRIEFWNTEAGGHLDPQQPGNAHSSGRGDPVTRAVAAFTYFVRDVAFLLDRMPDKAVQRAAHEPDHNGGDLPALRFFKPLRGRLVAVENDLPQVWSVAASEDGNMSVLVFNDGAAPLDVPLAMKAPAGFVFRGAEERRMEPAGAGRVPGPDAGPILKIVETPREAEGAEWAGSTRLEGKQAALYVFRLVQAPAGGERAAADGSRRVVRHQFVAPNVLQALDKDSAEFRIALPPEALAAAHRAQVRLVTDTSSELATTLNGEQIFSGRTDTLIRDVEVPLSILKSENLLTFKAAPARGRVLAASIWLEARR